VKHPIFDECIARDTQANPTKQKGKTVMDSNIMQSKYNIYDIVRPEEDLGRAVPARRNVVGEVLLRPARADDAREAEVAEFDRRVAVDQQICGFDVAMDDAGGVPIIQSAGAYAEDKSVFYHFLEQNSGNQKRKNRDRNNREIIGTSEAKRHKDLHHV
jgi:hypothetical protein